MELRRDRASVMRCSLLASAVMASGVDASVGVGTERSSEEPSAEAW